MNWERVDWKQKAKSKEMKSRYWMRKGERKKKRETEEEKETGQVRKRDFLKDKKKKNTSWNKSNEIGKENENQSEKYKKKE